MDKLTDVELLRLFAAVEPIAKQDEMAYDTMRACAELKALRAQPENKPLTRCENCARLDKSITFMSAHACAFWSSGKKTRYTENYEFCSFAERKEEHNEAD